MQRPLDITAIGIFFLVFFVFSVTYPVFASPVLEKYDILPQLLKTPVPIIMDSIVGAGYEGPSYIAYQIFYSKYPSDPKTERFIDAAILGIGVAGLTGAIGILRGKNWGRIIATSIVMLELFLSVALFTLQTFILLPTAAYSILILFWLSRRKVKHYFR